MSTGIWVNRVGRSGHMNGWCVLEVRKERIPLFAFSSTLSLSLGRMRGDFCRVCWSVSHHQCREKKRGEAFFKSEVEFMAAMQQEVPLGLHFGRFKFITGCRQRSQITQRWGENIPFPIHFQRDPPPWSSCGSWSGAQLNFLITSVHVMLRLPITHLADLTPTRNSKLHNSTSHNRSCYVNYTILHVT